MTKGDQYIRQATNVIKELMELQGVTQKFLAVELDVTPSYVSQTLSNRYNTSASTLETFANALGSTLAVSVTSIPLPIQEVKGGGKLTPKKGGKKSV